MGHMDVHDSGGCIDLAMARVLRTDLDPKVFPVIEVFELDGRLYSINNRGLFMPRVLTYKGVHSAVTARFGETQHRNAVRQL